MIDTILCHSVGALLYSPANNETIITSLVCNKFKTPFSLALCLEDTIRDDCVEEAELKLIESMGQLLEYKNTKQFYLPKIFIRVREPGQASRLFTLLKETTVLLTGFILPKFCPENADSYIEEMKTINQASSQPVYMMPILESPLMIDLRSRYQLLYTLKEKLDAVSDFVLNIRVGGNDLSHAFGYRRQSSQIIQEIKPVYQILSDIMTVFGIDYVVSGPVWEYYAGEGWDTGLCRELSHDRLNGFIGKTVIHPNQIPLVNAAFQVSKSDYKDAATILNWDTTLSSMVSGSTLSNRMNEYKTHYNWARKIIILSQIYGISDSGS